MHQLFLRPYIHPAPDMMLQTLRGPQETWPTSLSFFTCYMMQEGAGGSDRIEKPGFI